MIAQKKYLKELKAHCCLGGACHCPGGAYCRLGGVLCRLGGYLKALPKGFPKG